MNTSTKNGNDILLVIEDDQLAQSLQDSIAHDNTNYFIVNAHPTREFFLSNHFDLSILDIQSTSFTHIINTIITLVADEEDGTPFHPIIILSDGDTLARINDIAALIELYVYRRDDPFELLSHQIRSILNHRSKLARIKDQLNGARKVALLSMSASSQLGEVVRFHEISYTANGYHELGVMLIESFKLLGASCSGLFWVSNESHYFGNVDNKDHVLHALNDHRDRSRYVDVDDGTLIYFDNVWVYVTDMPAVDSEEYGQLKDTMFPLIEGAGQRAHTIHTEKCAAISQRSKAWFLKNVSHELRTPMGTLLNSLYLLKRKKEGDQYNQRDIDILKLFEEGSNQLADLIEDLLTLSDIENISVVKQTFSATKVIESSIDLLKNWATNKGLTFTVNFEPDDFQLFSDPKFIKQLLRSLISNAVKYTEKGGVDVTIKQLGEGNHTELEIKIEDTGLGFDTTHTKKLLKPFSELDENSLQNGQGAGLGLSVVYQLLKQMDGALEIQSERGQGSCFILTIPTHSPDNADNLLF